MINSINFGSSSATKHNLEHTSLNGEIKNTTTFFRKDLDWNRLADIISKDFKAQTPIYLGAGSDGSEACSLKMLLEKKAPGKNFHILSFDIFEAKVNESKQGITDIWNGAQSKIKKFVGSKIFNKNFIKIPNSGYEIGKKSIHGGALFKMTEHLKEMIDFKVADVVEFTQQKFKEPCVFLFRNAWPYLKPEKQLELAENLKNNLPEKSLVVIGSYDVKKGNIAELLLLKGFKSIEGSRFIFRK